MSPSDFPPPSFSSEPPLLLCLPCSAAGAASPAAAVQAAAVHLLLPFLPRVVPSLPLTSFPNPLSPFARATAAGSSARPPPRRRRGELTAARQGLISRAQ
jgi:hypothetical protein